MVVVGRDTVDPVSRDVVGPLKVPMRFAWPRLRLPLSQARSGPVPVEGR